MVYVIFFNVYMKLHFYSLWKICKHTNQKLAVLHIIKEDFNIYS